MQNIKEDDKATNEWLNSQKKRTKHGYGIQFAKFLEYTKMTGDEILADRKTDTEHRWERKVVAFKGWLISEKGLSEYTATLAAMAVRGFFAYHYSQLQYRAGERKRISEKNRAYEDYLFQLSDLKAMFDIADLTERYVISAGKSFGLRAGDFLRLTRGDLEPYITREPPISIGALKTLKESVKAYPFVDSDAQPIIKLMLEKMAREGKKGMDERMLPFAEEIQLSRILRRVAQRAGINTGSKKIRFHNLRKFLIDKLSSHMSESKWKQIVGKKVSESAYVSPEGLREDYARVMAETTFVKAVTNEDAKLVAQIESLKMYAKLQGVSEEHMARIFKARKTVAGIDEIRAALEDELAKQQSEDNCKDGEHCGETFKQIPEAQLLQTLKEGWAIAYSLTGGQVIVKR